MGLLDSTSEEPRSKLRRHIVSGVALALLVALAFWYAFRFHAEKRTVERFLDAVIAGNMEQAYRLWHPQPSYSYNDFLLDWGPSGYYGPIRSYHVEAAQEPPRRAGGDASGVIVVAEVSPYQPFPSDSDTEESRRTKEIRLWVERSDQSLSFPP